MISPPPPLALYDLVSFYELLFSVGLWLVFRKDASCPLNYGNGLQNRNSG